MAMKKYKLNDPKVVATISNLVDCLIQDDQELSGEVRETGDKGDSNEHRYPIYKENPIYQDPEELSRSEEGYAPKRNPEPEEIQGYAPKTEREVEKQHPEEEMIRLDDLDEDLDEDEEVLKVYLNQPLKY